MRGAVGGERVGLVAISYVIFVVGVVVIKWEFGRGGSRSVGGCFCSVALNEIYKMRWWSRSLMSVRSI
jgi:hypothetical protein